MIALFLVVILILTIGILFAFVASSKNVRKSNDLDDFPKLSFDSQELYRPIRRLMRSIRETSEQSTDPAVRAMAGSVNEEVSGAHDRVVQVLQTRDMLRKAIEDHVSAESEVERLGRLRDNAESAQEKLAYTKALEAKTTELAEYNKAKVIIKKIENDVELTKASLSELKTKLAVSDATANATERADDLRASLGSLDTIQSSMVEAQEILGT